MKRLNDLAEAFMDLCTSIGYVFVTVFDTLTYWLTQAFQRLGLMDIPDLPETPLNNSESRAHFDQLARDLTTEPDRTHLGVQLSRDTDASESTRAQAEHVIRTMHQWTVDRRDEPLVRSGCSCNEWNRVYSTGATNGQMLQAHQEHVTEVVNEHARDLAARFERTDQALAKLKADGVYDRFPSPQ